MTIEELAAYLHLLDHFLYLMGRNSMTIEELAAYLDKEIAKWETEIRCDYPVSQRYKLFREGSLAAMVTIRELIKTPGELEAELDAAEPVPLSEERIAEMVRFATQGDPNGRAGLD